MCTLAVGDLFKINSEGRWGDEAPACLTFPVSTFVLAFQLMASA